MWIRRAIYDAGQTDLTEQRAEARILRESATAARVQIAFLMARVNQLEKERAIMLRALTKLEIPIPELAVAAPASPIPQDAILSAMGASMFDDMGDTAARQEGIRWDPSGRVQYDDAPANVR